MNKATGINPSCTQHSFPTIIFTSPIGRLKWRSEVAHIKRQKISGNSSTMIVHKYKNASYRNLLKEENGAAEKSLKATVIYIYNTRNFSYSLQTLPPPSLSNFCECERG